MKYSHVALAALAQHAAAFPAMADAGMLDGALEPRQQKGGFPEPKPGFNAKQQLVDVSGEHRWIAPDFEAGDVRGPCPGLNAMANHGYLPRSGVGGHLDFIQGTLAVFGMSEDLSGFLTVFGATLDGDGLQWSIGGPSKHLPGVPPLIGTPQGISGSHNRYEADVSPTRGDLYKFNNDYSLQMPQFELLYNMGMAAGDEYSLATLRDFRAKRFQNSIKTNPYFFNGPFTGTLVAPAAFEFIYRFMGNKSETHPRGHLKSDVLMSFFSVKKKNGKLVHTPGYERIPDNWYKRAIGDEYSIPLLNLDTVAAATVYPEFFAVGGNTGKVNTFTGVDIQKLTGGAFNAQSLSQGNNLACFAMEFAVQAAPDAIRCSGVLGDVEAQMAKLNAQLGKSLAGLSCPQIKNPNNKQFSKFPGYTKLNCKTGTYSP